MSAVNLGFFNTSTYRTMVRFQFSTHAGGGGNIAPLSAFEAADLRIYKAADSAAFSATQRSSSSGVTMTSPFDSLTGFHDVAIDLTDNTDSGFYASGGFYSVVLAPDTETIDLQTVTGIVLAYFEIGACPANVTQFGGTAGTFASGIPEVKVNNIAANAITATSIASDAITDAKVASDVTIASVTGSVGSVSGNVGGNVTGTIGGLTAAALKDFFDTDSTTTYASAVAGSVVKEMADNAGGSSLTVGAIADAVWDEAQSGHTTAGTFGKYLDAQVSAAGGGSADWTADEKTTIKAILGIPGSGTTPDDPTTGILDTIRDAALAVKAKTDNLPASPAAAGDCLTQANVRSAVGLASANLDTQLDALPTNAELATALGTADDATLAAIAALDTKIDTIDDFIDTEVAAIKAKTDNLPSDPADASDIAALFVTHSPNWYTFKLTPAFTTTSGTTLRLVGLVEYRGQRKDVYAADNTATCALAVREHGAGSDLFTITATTVDANGTFELSKSSPGLTADRLYRYTATVVISGVTYTFEDAFPNLG